MQRFTIFLLLASLGAMGAVLVSGGCNSKVASYATPVESQAEKSPTNPTLDPVQPDAPTTKAEAEAPDDLQVITFDDLNIGMQKDMPFRPLMLEYEDGRAKKLIGKRINVGGYMNPTDTFDGVQEFILLKNLDCKFGPGGQADHLVHVLLQDGETTKFTDAVIYVEGELELKPYPEQGPTWSIYDLKATKVSTRPPPRDRR